MKTATEISARPGDDPVHIVQQAPKQNINIRRSNHTTPEGGQTCLRLIFFVFYIIQFTFYRELFINIHKLSSYLQLTWKWCCYFLLQQVDQCQYICMYILFCRHIPLIVFPFYCFSKWNHQNIQNLKLYFSKVHVNVNYFLLES